MDEPVLKIEPFHRDMRMTATSIGLQTRSDQSFRLFVGRDSKDFKGRPVHSRGILAKLLRIRFGHADLQLIARGTVLWAFAPAELRAPRLAP